MMPPSSSISEVTPPTTNIGTNSVPNGNNSAHPQRAVHQIRFSAIRHNYGEISRAASRQHCGVIVVCKADGYGHGSSETAIHLADYCGADAFAVATVDEGVTLRKALNQVGVGVQPAATNKNASISSSTTQNGSANATKIKSNMNDLFQPPASVVEISTGSGCDTSSIASTSVVPAPINNAQLGSLRKQARSPNIRILVLGPPTNLPDDFALYQQFNLELMCSGPQMARALMEWVQDSDGRRIQEVEKAATYQKSILLEQTDEEETSKQIAKNKKVGQASTLSNVEGAELGKELRQILLKKEAFERNTKESGGSLHGDSAPCSKRGSVVDSTTQPVSSSVLRNSGKESPTTPNMVPFKGIEDAAKMSRAREKAAAKVAAQTTGEDEEDYEENSDDNILEQENNDKISDTSSTQSSTSHSLRHEDDIEHHKVVSAVSSATVKDATAKVAHLAIKKGTVPTTALRKIRWHALVDSGMGRLGFKSVEDEDEEGDEDHAIPLDKLPGPLQAHSRKKDPKWKVGPHKDTVSIIKAMVDAEIYGGAPIEFYGMCTHMAEASSDSDYTNEQMNRFKSLLKRVRQAGISVPTISTDNSSALLTTNLNHFNPNELLVQKNVTNSLGFVRTGGGIFGQRPAFPQLKAVSTLSASVRHVAILQKGQTVGYDRAYVADKNVRIATLTIGFADGYPRDLGNGKGMISIRGKLFPVAGNVCMDMVMVDLGPAEDIDSIGAKVTVGDRAVLWGPESKEDNEGNIRLQDIASSLKTTQSALTCGLNKVRVQRIYVD